MSTDDPGLEDLIDAIIGHTLGRIRVAYHGVVVSYEPATQQAIVKPTQQLLVRPSFEVEGLVPVTQPPTPPIPVLFPGNQLYSLTWPLAPGDRGFLIISDRSTDEWRATGVEAPPVHGRRFNMADAAFLPANATPAFPLPPTAVDPASMVIQAPQIKLGSNAASDLVALSSLVSANLTAIANAIELLDLKINRLHQLAAAAGSIVPDPTNFPTQLTPTPPVSYSPTPVASTTTRST